MLIVTPGAADANSYCSMAQADAYHDGHVSREVWSDADAATKELALRQATRLLDAHVEWTGLAVSQTQALGWPRYGAYSRNGYLLPSTSIPQDVVNATAELARVLLAGDRAADSDVDTQGIRRIEAGPVSLEFREGVGPKPIPDAVFFLVRHLGTVQMQRGSGAVPLVRA